MKRVLIILSLASCMFAGEMGLSAYGGLTMANISPEEADGMDYGMKPGLNFGVHYNKLPVILGAGISMRGSKITVDDEDVATFSFTYLDLSVLYPIAAGPGRAFVGLDIGVALSGELDQEGGDAIDLMGSDCEDCMNGLDYGLLLGYTYPINEDMGVSVGYYLGLADWTGDGFGDGADKHNGLLLNVGYALPF